jgi:predicted nucleic acid-binding protein
MPERVVCNASPLIFLAKIDKLDFLNDYELFIPFAVESEISKGLKNKKADARQIQEYLRGRGITSRRAALLKDLPHYLGAGEKAVISLAVKEKIKRVLIDEAKARTVARFKGLEPKGTLGILWDAYKAGRIEKEVLESLALDIIQKGYRVKEEILIEFLRKLRGK